MNYLLKRAASFIKQCWPKHNGPEDRKIPYGEYSPFRLRRRSFKREVDDDRPLSAIVGEWGESVTAAFLEKAGYRIIGRNVRPNRRDEIDIIARKDKTLVFVEVKTRSDEDFGSPASAVDRDKRHKLNRAAVAYLRKARFPNLFYRFDVFEIVGEPGDVQPEIRHIEDAFPFESRFRFPV